MLRIQIYIIINKKKVYNIYTYMKNIVIGEPFRERERDFIFCKFFNLERKHMTSALYNTKVKKFMKSESV